MQFDRLPKTAVKTYTQSPAKLRGLYWGRIEFSPGLHAERVMLTPEIASALLGKVLPRQRKVRKSNVATMIADIKAGRWKFNGEPIILDASGHMIDGQHRCHACVGSGMPIDVLIVSGVPESVGVYESIDGGTIRTGHDALKDIVSNANSVATVLNFLHRYNTSGRIAASNGVRRVSGPHLAELLARYPGVEDSVRAASRAKAVVTWTGTAAFCHYIMASIDREDADRFFELIASGEDMRKGDPVYAFRQYCIVNRGRLQNFDSCAHAMIKAWNAWRQGQQIQILKTPNSASNLPTPI